MVLRGALGVEAKAALAAIPAVRERHAVGGDFAVAVEVFRVNPEINIGGERSAVADAGEVMPLRAAACLEVKPLGIAAVLGGDVDHAVDGVGPPKGAAGAADDLDTVHVRQQVILHVPNNAGEQRRVERAAVQQDEQFVADGAVEAARADRPTGGSGLGDIQIAGETERLGKTHGAGAADVFLGDDLNGGRGLRQRFGLPGN